MRRSLVGLTVSGTVLVAALLLGACRPTPLRDRAVVAYPSGPAALAPDTVSEEITISILSNVYEALVDFDGKLALLPGLAESWYTEDDTTWVFRLREGVRFHDGRTLTAKDAANAIEWSRSAPESKRRGELSNVTAVEAKDARTLVVRTSEPTGSLPHRLAAVSIWIPGAGPQDPPLGTGPYRFENGTVRGDVVLRAFEGYRGGPPRVRVLEFRVIPEPERRLALLEAGEVQLVPDVPQGEMSRLARLPQVRTLTQQGLRVLYLVMDVAHKQSPFHDLRVRRAVLLALDRQGLVRGPLSGLGEPIDQLVAPVVFGFAPELSRLPGPDPDAARRLLAAAGFGSGFDVDLDYAPRKYLAMNRIAAAIASDLGAAGIRLRLRPGEPTEVIRRIERRELTLCLSGWMSTGGDAGVSYDHLLHSPGGGFGTHNGGGWSDPEVDRLLAAQARELDAERRRELLGRVAAVVAAELPVIPLHRQMDLYAVARDLEFQPRADRRIRGAELRFVEPR